MTMALVHNERPSRRPAHVHERGARRSRAERKCRVSREHLTIVQPLVVRSIARRKRIRPGRPKALSWDVTPWEYDDHAWYVVSVHGELTCQQVAHLMGISKARVQQLEVEALAKLELGLSRVLAQLGIDGDDLPADFLRAAFALHDRRRLEEALVRERVISVPKRAQAHAL